MSPNLWPLPSPTTPLGDKNKVFQGMLSILYILSEKKYFF